MTAGGSRGIDDQSMHSDAFRRQVWVFIWPLLQVADSTTLLTRPAFQGFEIAGVAYGQLFI